MGIKVSIAMITYNHERFLAQALDSILMQKVNFEYEIVVGEDVSPDRTREILREYAAKYPDVIVPLYRSKNLGMSKNILDVIVHCRGEYIAFLEGDDYWTDPLKLQRQVDFLDKNPEYSTVAHGTDMVDINGNVINDTYFWWPEEKGDYTLENAESFELPFQTGSILIRNYSEDFAKIAGSSKASQFPIDRVFPFFMLQKGRVHIIPKMMSAYRLYFEEGGTNWSSKYDIRYKHNYLYHDIVIRVAEKTARRFGFAIDMSKARGRLMYDCYQCAKKEHRACFIQLILMFVLGPSRSKMWKEFMRIHRENKAKWTREKKSM